MNSSGKHNFSFPARLTAFEQYMISDDRDRYPMTFFVEISVSGQLLQSEFRQAVEQALSRHPLLTSTVSNSWRGPGWNPTGQTPEILWTEGAPQFCSLESRRMDLKNKLGLRISVGHDDESSRIVFQFHHAVADGIAGIQFIGDVLAFYGIATTGSREDRPELAPVDNACLALRSQLWEPNHKPNGLLKRLLIKGWEVLHREPCELHGADQQPDRSAPVNPFVTRVLHRSTVRDIRKRATTLNVTPNELYTTTMFQTLRSWNRQRGCVVEKQAFRVGVPVTLRTPSHDMSPAANILSYVFLTQTGQQIQNSEKLLSYVQREVHAMMNNWDSRLVPVVFDLIRKMPGGLKALTSIPRRFSTSMLANVGDVKRQLRNRFPIRHGKCVAGNVVLEYLLGAAPNRPGTALGTSLGTYAGQLFINFNCDPFRLSPNDAETIADEYVSRLIRVSEGDDQQDSGVSINDTNSAVQSTADLVRR